jgi:hypothetical protein
MRQGSGFIEKMRNIFDVSLDTANQFYSWGWRGSIAGALITTGAVILLMWGTRVRDRENEKQIAETTAGAARANERAANLEVQAAALRLEAEQARLATEKLKSQVAWRELSATQQAELTKYLKQNPGNVDLAFITGDQESMRFAMQLRHAFENAGWRLALQSRAYMTQSVFGVILPKNAINPGGKFPWGTKMGFVGDALKHVGIEYSTDEFYSDGGLQETRVILGTIPDATIIVGTKKPVL